MKKCPDPEWYVYVEDVNANKIKKFNVFNSFNFLKCCKQTFRKYKDPKKIEEEIKAWARYCFMFKYEYEIVLTCMTEKQNFKSLRIDVYNQLTLNWDSFFEYTMQHKAYFMRRTK